MATLDARTHFGMTDAGKMVLRGTLLVAGASLLVPVFGVLATLVAVMLVALVTGYLLRPKIRVTATLPDRIVAGQTVRLTYTLANVARLPAYNLRLRLLRLPEALEQVEDGHLVARLGPGRTVEIDIAVHAKRRGHYEIGSPLCESSFPFNLFRFSATHGRTEQLLVLPAFSRLGLSLHRLDRHVQAGGARLAGFNGVSPEYVGNRPFLPGDSPRRIDARAWARLSVPATKEYDDDFDNYAALILDTRVPAHLRDPSDRSDALEAAVSLCASVAFTMHRTYVLDLLLAGSDVHPFTRGPRTGRFERIHEMLADVQASTDFSAERIVPVLADRFHEISQVIFIVAYWDQPYRRLLEMAERAGCRTKVFLVGSPDAAGAEADDARWPHDAHVISAQHILTGRIGRL